MVVHFSAKYLSRYSLRSNKKYNIFGLVQQARWQCAMYINPYQQIRMYVSLIVEGLWACVNDISLISVLDASETIWNCSWPPSVLLQWGFHSFWICMESKTRLKRAKAHSTLALYLPKFCPLETLHIALWTFFLKDFYIWIYSRPAFLNRGSVEV